MGMAAHKYTNWMVSFALLGVGTYSLLTLAEAPVVVPNSVAQKGFVPATLTVQPPMQAPNGLPPSMPAPDSPNFGAGSSLVQGLPAQPQPYQGAFEPRPNGSDDPAKNQAIQQGFMGLLSSLFSGANGGASPPADMSDQQLLEYGGGQQYYGPPTGEAYPTGMFSNGISSSGTGLVGYNCDNRKQTDRFKCSVCNLVYEACGQPYNGQLAVARSVLTRVFSMDYSSTVCGNVYKVNGHTAQYSWVLENKNHTLRNNSCLNSAIKATMEAFNEGPNGKTNYYNPSLANPNWGRSAQCQSTALKIGAHKFCVQGGLGTRSISSVANAENISMANARSLAGEGAASRQ